MRIIYRPRRSLFPPVEDGCYGYLYNGYAVIDSRNITSDGWHIPTDPEIRTLRSYLDPSGGDVSNVAGGYLKEIGFDYWTSPNTGADNSAKFKGRGVGRRESGGQFISINELCDIYTSTEYLGTSLYIGSLSYNSARFWTNAVSNKKYGLTVRPVKNSTTLSHGQQGTYTGNDGKVYSTICIGTQEWLQQNLEETQFRNGDYIYNIEDATTWSNLTEGALCLYDNNETYACKTPLPKKPCYGYLYNFYAINDSKELTSSTDWRVATRTEWSGLYSLLSAGTEGNKLKIPGIIYWNTDNGTNDYGFNAKGGSQRNSIGSFLTLKATANWGSSVTNNRITLGTTGKLQFSSVNLTEGVSVRLTKDATGLADGVTTTYTGNDGKTYNAIVINELYWTTENLEETEYRNGDPIPNVTDNTAWSNLTTGAWCVYDNNNDYKCK